MKRSIGWGPEQRSFCLRGAWGLASWHVEAFWSPKHGSFQKAVLLGVYGGFITLSRLTKPFTIGWFKLQPLPFLQRGWDWKFQHFNHLVGPPGDQPLPLCGVQNSPSLITSHPLHLYDSETFIGTEVEDSIYLGNIFWSSEWQNLYFL